MYTVLSYKNTPIVPILTIQQQQQKNVALISIMIK